MHNGIILIQIIILTKEKKIMPKQFSSPADAADKTYRGLRNFNLIMGFLHLAQGIFMIVSRSCQLNITSCALASLQRSD